MQLGVEMLALDQSLLTILHRFLGIFGELCNMLPGDCATISDEEGSRQRCDIPYHNDSGQR